MENKVDSLFDESNVNSNDEWLRAAMESRREQARIATGHGAAQEYFFFIPRKFARESTIVEHKE